MKIRKEKTMQGVGPYRSSVLKMAMKEPKLAIFIAKRYWTYDDWRLNTRKRHDRFDKAGAYAGLFVGGALLSYVASLLIAINLAEFGMWGLLAALLQAGALVAGVVCLFAGIHLIMEFPGFLKRKSGQLRDWAEREVNKWEI